MPERFARFRFQARDPTLPSMTPERSDTSEVPPEQSAPVAAAVSDADLSRAIPAQAGRVGASPDLMVRALNQNRLLQGGRTYRVGRDPESDIAINDPRVSWAHGVLRVEGA